MTRLFLVRHAQSAWNVERRWQGQADPELSERGLADAAEAARRLPSGLVRVVSSDLRRAAATADALAAAAGLGPVERDPALREIDVGQWSGLTSDEIEARWPGAIERWREVGIPGAGGEERAAFRERIVAALREHARRPGPALVVTHGAVIGVLERDAGVHPGRAVPWLAGRWFEVDDVAVRSASDRISLGRD